MGITLDAPPKQVWERIADVGSHVDWMEEAVAIHFVSRRRSGVGTVFDCDTKVGPFRLVDRMTITEWRPGRAMGVRHEGLINGAGRFTLARRRRRRTRFTWDERLFVPWHLGGPVAAVPIGLVLRRVWRRNLSNLKAIVETGATSQTPALARATRTAATKHTRPSPLHSAIGVNRSRRRGPSS